MAWSDLKLEVVFYPFCAYALRSANRPQSALEIVIPATFSQTYRFSGILDRISWSDLIPKVVLWQFLRLRSESLAQNPLKVASRP